MAEELSSVGMPEAISAQYSAQRDAVLNAYRELSGLMLPDSDPSHGTLADEAEVKRRTACPWPYSTGDGRTVGSVLSGIGFALDTCRARRGHRVLELGATTGHLSMAMARMGCTVTVRADDSADTEALRRRVGQSGLSLTVRSPADPQEAKRFDLVLSHGSLARRLEHPAHLATMQRLLAPGGRLVLVGEQLREDLPAPWMLDPSLTEEAAREGAFVLAFRPTYLIGLLTELGFDATLFVCPTSHHGNTVVAGRRSPPQRTGGE